MDFDAGRFGSNLRRLRQAKGWSIREFADRAGLAKNTVLRIEHGEPSTKPARTRASRAVGTFEELVLAIEQDEQLPYELVPAEAARWRISFFSPQRKLPADVDDLIQDPKERARLAHLGWVSRYEKQTVPRRSARFPGVRMMEIWSANGVMGTHHDVELATAIKGGVRILLGDERIELKEGEGISFLADIAHDYEPIVPIQKGGPPVLVLYVLVPIVD